MFDKDGKKDVLGTLNLLTPDVVKEAYKELKEGVSVSLNWPIGAIETPGFGRKGLVHKVVSFVGTPLDATATTTKSNSTLNAAASGTRFATFTTNLRRVVTMALKPVLMSLPDVRQ